VGDKLILAPPWLDKKPTDYEHLPPDFWLSSDGRTVYTDGFYDLRSGRKLRTSVRPSTVFGWSPDRRWLLVRERRALVAVSASGLRPRVLVRPPPDTNLAWVRWQPNGLVGYRLTTATFQRLHVLDLATGSIRPLKTIDPNGEPSYEDPVWSPDGGTLAAVRSDQRGSGPSWLVLFGSNGEAERRLGGQVSTPRSGWRPTWTSDGRIVHVAEGAILARRLTDGKDDLLATFPDVRDASLSPDGRQLAVVTMRALTLVPLDGSGLRTVLATFPGNSAARPYPTEPTWSPDGTRIAFTSPQGLSVVRADGATPPLVLVRATARPSGPAWSPDGQRIVFAVADPACEDRLRLMVVDTAGGEATHVYRTPRCSGLTGPSWRP
jgi:dipeptidyl aminopeptidase/acylaminoacyl peptidase